MFQIIQWSIIEGNFDMKHARLLVRLDPAVLENSLDHIQILNVFLKEYFSINLSKTSPSVLELIVVSA